MIPRPPRSIRTDPLFPYTTLFRSRRHAISIGMGVLANIVIVSFGAFFLIDLLRSLPEPLGAYGVGALLLAVYAGLIWFCSRYPDLEMDDPSAPALSLPVPGPTIKDRKSTRLHSSN